MSSESTRKTALFIGAHHDEIEVECPILPCKLASKGLRVVIVNPMGGWNWHVIRLKGKGAKEKIRDEALKAAEVLGCEKIIWDYPASVASSDHRPEITRRLAELLMEINPAFVFIHWPYDSHPDHRLISQISYHVLQSARNIVDDPQPELLTEEVFAFQAAIYQTRDFWPDFCVLANEEEMNRVQEALLCFETYGEERERWWRGLQAKSAGWAHLVGDGPAEAYKFIGPHLPIRGLALAELLGDDIRAVTNEHWCFGKDFHDTSVP